MKRFMSAVLFFCLVCLPLSALANPHQQQYGHHEQHRVFVSANNGGEVSPDGAISVREGRSVTIHIRPHFGYVVKKVIVDGKNVGPVNRYRLSDIDEAHRVHVVFERAHHFGGHQNDRHDRHGDQHEN